MNFENRQCIQLDLNSVAASRPLTLIRLQASSAKHLRLRNSTNVPVH